MSIPPNTTDLNRALGRVEGDIGAMKESVDRIEALVRDMDKRLAQLEAKENQRKGAIVALMGFSGFIGGLVAKFGALIFGAGGTH